MLQNKKTETLKIQGFRSLFRADDGNRTRDLRTTNATLYRLSHSSLFCFGALSRTLYILSCPYGFVNNNFQFFQSLFCLIEKNHKLLHMKLLHLHQ